MAPNSATHSCSDHYEPKSEETHFSCDGCKMNGFGPRYTCTLCGDNLHKECKNPKPTITHDFFGCSVFAFLPKPFTKPDQENQTQLVPANHCNACGKDIFGFSYHSEPQNLNLHPCCRNLQKKVKVNDGIVFDLKPSLSSKCSYCNNDNEDHIRGKTSWAYVSSCKKYNFHVYCMKERIYIAKMKNGKVDLRDLLGTHTKWGDFFEEYIKPLLMPIIDVLLQLFGEHGLGAFKKVTVSQFLTILVQKSSIDENTRERIVLAAQGMFKHLNLVFENASLHDLFEAVNSGLGKGGSVLLKFFNLIAESLGKLVKRKQSVPVGGDRMV